jgi:hypothetical protein
MWGVLRKSITERGIDEEMGMRLRKKAHDIRDSINTAAEHYANIHLMLRTKGDPIRTPDLWIAASALQRSPDKLPLGCLLGNSGFRQFNAFIMTQRLAPRVAKKKVK